MPTNDSQSGPPPLPGTEQAEETAQVPVAEPVSPQPRGDAAAPVRSRTHWPTVLLGALPATYLSFPAALGILVGILVVGKDLAGFATFFASVFGWTGMISLWMAARSRPTARQKRPCP